MPPLGAERAVCIPNCISESLNLDGGEDVSSGAERAVVVDGLANVIL